MRTKQLFKYAYNQIENGFYKPKKYRCIKTGADFGYELKDKILTIWIEPTNENKDWHTNFLASSENEKLGRFHAGYYIASKNFCAHISNLIFDEVRIFGYSMGAGIASVLACIIKDNTSNFCIVKCVSMEGARSVNRRANRVLKGNPHIKIYSIINNNDTVTKVPFNFTHAGEVIKIGDEPRRWWDTGFRFKLDLKQPFFLRKFITVKAHEYDDFKRNFKKYIDSMN